MCYRCELCRAVVPPRTLQLRHVTYHEVPVMLWGKPVGMRREIAHEAPVCPDCHDAIRCGDSPAVRTAIGDAMRRRDAELAEARQRAFLARVRGSSGNTANHRNGSAHPPVKLRWTGPSAQVVNVPKAPPPIDPRFFDDDPPPPESSPKCDVCGQDATHGQVTDHTILCPEHCRKAKGDR